MPLPSLRCVAPTGRVTGESSAPTPLKARHPKGKLLKHRSQSRMPTSTLTRAASNTRAAAVSLSRSAEGVAEGIVRTAEGITSKHSRMSLVAASAAAVGVLGASGFAVGAAPWSQALGNVAATVHGDSQVATGHPAAFAYKTITASKGTTELDVLHSAGAGSHATSTALSQRAAQPAAVKQATTTAATKAAQAAAAKAAASRAAAAKAAAARTAAAKAAAAHAAAAKVAAARAAAAKPYTMYDSVEPGSLPAGQAAAAYATGAYAEQPSQVAGHRALLWIDTNGSDPGANVLDVEPGDATPSGAAHWAQERLSTHKNSTAIIYTMRSDWQQVKENVAHLPSWMQSKVKYWIADPTGVSHIVPGSSATQWYWGSHYDITTANPDFHA
jgi:hypothetical protein